MGLPGGVKDTSRAGAYHNARFRDLGAELGLSIERYPAIGWSLTTVPDATAAAYAAQVEQLRAAIVHVRESEHHGRSAAGGGQGSGRARRRRRGRGRGGRRWLALGADLCLWLRACAAATDGAERVRGR